MKIAVGITGASGVIYGIRLLEALRETDNQVSLILSDWGSKTIALETNYSAEYVCSLADSVYDSHDLAAAVSSGSYGTEATVIAPCSMKTLAGVANGFSDNLIVRIADVALKERRPLVLMVRETPLTLIHLRNMTAVTEAGGIILPPMPGFYHKPQTIDDVINQSVGKVFDLLRIPNHLFRRWGESE
ncbi:UbiX family flavin prenyltransferase [Acetobacterium paludosum]|uniref:Flavin prenyltransferase UbiX n=1 Tax=Acetobacterium paludosum TaxID=52693 RepID=A0A923KWD3_9FIRM|nr:UbiX family flavin prenyltransferase [Acetobacterium paludosum]MBC3888335.1 UbiX family flavin prenyltransferase [Acetobacterium paludosum]